MNVHKAGFSANTRGLACRNRSNAIALTHAYGRHRQEIWQCLGISLRSNQIIMALAIWVLSTAPVLAQQKETGPDPAPGLTFLAVRQWTQPIADALAAIVTGAIIAWQYIMDHAPAAVFLSAILASYIAIRSIASQREMTRLRETFSTIDSSIRDTDVIKSRSEFRKIKNELEQSKGSVAAYQNPKTDGEIEKATTLRTILNNYENLSLGVRYNILDEGYLYRWTKTNTLHDWNYLVPLVTAHRSAGHTTAYMEFEGLATSWLEGKSYRTGKKMKPPNRRTKIH